MLKILFRSMIVGIFVAAPTIAQKKIEFTEAAFREAMNLNVCENKQRQDAVRALFQKFGAAADDIKIDKHKNVENLVITKKGKTDDVIILGAHYDKTDDGCGAIDNWTGLVVLANLYGILRESATEKTYMIVAFGKEEAGLVGSRAMAKNIKKEDRSKYCSMVNLDSFGLSYPQVLINTSNRKMTDLAEETAKAIKMKFYAVSLAGVADADSSSFLDVDIPAITFHGLSNRWKDYLHSSGDKTGNVNIASLQLAASLTFAYLQKLEALPCSEFRK